MTNLEKATRAELIDACNSLAGALENKVDELTLLQSRVKGLEAQIAGLRSALDSGVEDLCALARREGVEAAAKVAEQFVGEFPARDGIVGRIIAHNIRALYPAASSEDTTPTTEKKNG